MLDGTGWEISLDRLPDGSDIFPVLDGTSSDDTPPDNDGTGVIIGPLEIPEPLGPPKLTDPSLLVGTLDGIDVGGAPDDCWPGCVGTTSEDIELLGIVLLDIGLLKVGLLGFGIDEVWIG